MIRFHPNFSLSSHDSNYSDQSVWFHFWLTWVYLWKSLIRGRGKYVMKTSKSIERSVCHLFVWVFIQNHMIQALNGSTDFNDYIFGCHRKHIETPHVYVLNQSEDLSGFLFILRLIWIFELFKDLQRAPRRMFTAVIQDFNLNTNYWLEIGNCLASYC